MVVEDVLRAVCPQNIHEHQLVARHHGVDVVRLVVQVRVVWDLEAFFNLNGNISTFKITNQCHERGLRVVDIGVRRALVAVQDVDGTVVEVGGPSTRPLAPAAS